MAEATSSRLVIRSTSGVSMHSAVGHDARQHAVEVGRPHVRRRDLSEHWIDVLTQDAGYDFRCL